MTDCPVCSSYPEETSRLLDRMGTRHRTEMSRMRRLEAEGRPISELQPISRHVIAAAERTQLG